MVADLAVSMGFSFCWSCRCTGFCVFLQLLAGGCDFGCFIGFVVGYGYLYFRVF